MNNTNKTEEELKAGANLKFWSEESIIIGILAKKFGKNGILELDLKPEDFPKSVNFSIKDNKAFIYAE